MKKIKLTIIGTITQDTIVFPDGKKKEDFGGILYNILPLVIFAPQNLVISPVCNLGSDVYDRVMSFLKKFRNLDTRGIFKVKGENNHVFLYYDQKGNKKEILKGLVPKIKFDQVKAYLRSDYILINFISGFDMSLEVLKKLKGKSEAQFFMDVHSLLLGVKKNGERFFRVPALWREYLKTADIVQMNFKEMQVLSGGKLDSENKMKKFADKILSLGPKILLVTCGNKGALVYYKKKGEFFCYQTSYRRVKDVVDSTGCGDVFSTGFILAYLRTHKVELSAEYANFIAGMKSKFSGIDGFLRIHFKKRKEGS